jgi:hypothetical protein
MRAGNMEREAKKLVASMREEIEKLVMQRNELNAAVEAASRKHDEIEAGLKRLRAKL